MAEWTRKYINSLPDSSFAYIEPGGKKDSEGKTEPRYLRHLPYKDASGKIDIIHVRAALRYLSRTQNIPMNIKSKIQVMFQTILSKGKAESGINITLPAQKAEFKILQAEGDKPKRVLISGKLMNNLFNANYWRVPAHELQAIADGIPESSVDIQHSDSDWDVVGQGDEGFIEGTTIFYTDIITDPKAVEKFESGTWTAKNMGISPEISFSSLECSICNEDIRTCEHRYGQSYDGDICGVTATGSKLVRQGLTTRPAYREAGAGTVDFVSLAASINEDFYKNMEETKMSEKTVEDFKSLLAEKDKNIDSLKSEVKTLSEKIKRAEEEETQEKEKEQEKVETENKELKEKVETLEKEKEEAEAKAKIYKEGLDKFVKAHRKSELEKRLGDKDLVASYLEKDMTDEEFKAEIDKIEKIQAKAREGTGVVGSVPSDETSEKAKERYEKLGAEMFGENFSDLIGDSDNGNKGD